MCARDITETSFTERYRTKRSAELPPEYGDEDREYTWENFQGVSRLVPEGRGARVVHAVSRRSLGGADSNFRS